MPNAVSKRLPEGWKIERLGRLVSKVGSGVTPKGGSNTYLPSGIPLIRSQNVLWGKLDLADVAYIDAEQHKKMQNSVVHSRDVLLNITGASIGRCCIVPEQLQEANVNQHVCIIRPAALLSAYYLCDVLLSPIGQKQVEQFQAGGNRQGLNFEQVNSFKIPLPPLPEQKKIAEILGTWDKAIESVEKLIASSQQQKKALMQQLLTGKRRFPGFKGKWGRHYFKDLMDIDLRSINTNADQDFVFRYISLSDVSNGAISSQLEQHSLRTAPSRARRAVRAKDILMATVRPNLQGFAKITPEYADCIASTGFAVLSPTKVDPDYLIHYIFSDYISNQINALVVGSNYPAINSSDVAQLRIFCPDQSEQHQIAQILNTSEEQLRVLGRNLDKLKREKQILMQQLLSGKRRVKVD